MAYTVKLLGHAKTILVRIDAALLFLKTSLVTFMITLSSSIDNIMAFSFQEKHIVFECTMLASQRA